MSVSFSCHCPERKKPVRERKWVVIQRNCNHSAFNGYHKTPSEYSDVYCQVCRALGRTKARYVDLLKDGIIK
jgi:hypothetical protein